MTDNNRDYVAVYADRDVMYWTFVLPSEATTCEEQAKEMLDRCETLFGTFEEFLAPTRVELLVNQFRPGHTLPAANDDAEWIDSVSPELRDPNGISPTDVRDAATVSEANDRWIPRIFVPGTKVRIRLEGGDVWADRTNHTIEYMSGRPTDRDPTVDPIEVTLLHHENESDPEITADHVSSVLISPFSDIWFEDSEIGRKNADRLAAFLGRIEEMMPVEKVERTSDWLPVERLEEIY